MRTGASRQMWAGAALPALPVIAAAQWEHRRKGREGAGPRP
jgi:hypothetical protein